VKTTYLRKKAIARSITIITINHCIVNIIYLLLTLFATEFLKVGQSAYVGGSDESIINIEFDRYDVRIA